MSGGPGFWYSGLIGSSLLKDAGATPLGCTGAFSSITIKSEAPDCRAELTAALHPLIKNLDALNRNGAGLTHWLRRMAADHYRSAVRTLRGADRARRGAHLHRRGPTTGRCAGIAGIGSAERRAATGLALRIARSGTGSLSARNDYF